jgi:hypothetical protein
VKVSKLVQFPALNALFFLIRMAFLGRNFPPYLSKASPRVVRSDSPFEMKMPRSILFSKARA